MSAKVVINDKLQGSVVTYLRCGGVVHNRVKIGLLLSLLLKQKKSVNICHGNKLERDCLVYFVRLAKTLLKDGESARNNQVLCKKTSPIFWPIL